MCTKRQLEMIKDEMVKCYRTVYGNSIVGIFLYGSYARESFTDESDIDIVAIVDGERKAVQESLKLVWDYSADVGLEHDVVISPAAIPKHEFEHYKDKLPYYRNIEREGLRIG